MEEREVITLGFGNYATLVAAQWANSTSRYDVAHHTLYRERDSHRILGGGNDDGDASSSVAFSGRTVHVPRLLLLDAPHASDFKDLSDVAGEMEQWERQQKEDEEEQHDEARARRAFADPSSDASSLLWQKPNERQPTAEEKRLDNMVKFAHKRWGPGQFNRHRRSYDSDEENEEEEHGSSHDEDDDGEEDYYFQLERHQGRGIEVEPPYNPAALAANAEKEAEANDEELRRPSQPLTKETYKRKLFKRKDGAIPWWRYITTGLDVDSITTMRPPQHVDAGGEFPTLHNVGYGLSSFKSGNGAAGAAQEAEAFTDALRRQLEDADRLQGLQCFIDGDSMFAGAAHNVLTEFWEDVGAKMPVTAFTVFSPLPAALTDLEVAKSIPFAERRRDEVALNRLLCTSLLSQPSAAVYLPIEVADWTTFFASSGAKGRSSSNTDDAVASCEGCWWLDDDTATAQYIAAVADSALYGLRDGAAMDGRSPNKHGDDGSNSGPAYYMTEWARTLRPTPSMRVSALLGSLPMRIPPVPKPTGKPQDRASDLWAFLEGMPLLPGTAVNANGEATTSLSDTQAAVNRFVPLTHAFTKSPQTESGRVVGHAVSLRGAGVLPSAVYPTREAMLRYALPLRTGTYLPLLTKTNMPISSTLPLSLLFDSAAAHDGFAQQCQSVGLHPRDAVAAHGLDVGAHTVTSYQSAPMLGRIVSEAKAVLRYKEHLHGASYNFEKDDWTERLEDVAEIFDDYHHQSYDEDANDDDDDNDW